MNKKQSNIKKSHKGIFTAFWILILLAYPMYTNYSLNTVIIAVDLPLSHTIEISKKGSTEKFEFDGSAFFGDYKNDPEALLNYDLKSLGLKKSDFSELYDMVFYKESTGSLDTIVCIFPSEKISHVDFSSIVPAINQFYPYDNDHYIMLKIRGKYFALTKQQVENFVSMEQYINN